MAIDYESMSFFGEKKKKSSPQYWLTEEYAVVCIQIYL